MIRSRCAQRGLSLVEALVSFAIAAVGMTALIVTQSGLRQGADLNRQRAEGLRLAQQEVERLRAFASVDELQHLAKSAGETAGPKGNAHFTTERRVEEEGSPGTLAAAVDVRWTDRAGKPAVLTLHTLVAGLDPALSGALIARPARQADAQLAGGRSAAIPPQAIDLGDGRSAFTPPGAGGITWIFDNRSAEVTSVCAAPAATVGATLDAASDRCLPVAGRLISGHVRFSGKRGLDLDMRLDTPDGAASCFDDASSRTHGASVAYHCLVTLHPGQSAWSGRLDVVPIGWALGTEETAYRVCRYSSDSDGRKGIGNHEHPLHYQAVGEVLQHQNFLVVPGAQGCPTEGARTVEHAPQPQETPT